jgi:hypothetical protein
MTNVSSTPAKVATRSLLFEIAEKALAADGWVVERIARSGKSSVRRITRGQVAKTVSIRTSQDTWIAFPRNEKNTGWATLEEVDYVVAATVDSHENPRAAHIHFIEGDEMRARFDRAYAARKAATYTLPQGRGIWLSLYEKESNHPVTLVGAGAGLAHPPIAKVPLVGQKALRNEHTAVETVQERDLADDDAADDEPLTINEAKRRLALSLGVSKESIKIIITE